jgi:hypothetical protein
VALAQPVVGYALDEGAAEHTNVLCFAQGVDASRRASTVAVRR